MGNQGVPGAFALGIAPVASLCLDLGQGCAVRREVRVVTTLEYYMYIYT